MSHSETKYQNENISIDLTKQPGCRVKMDIIVSPGAVQSAHKKAIKSLSKEVSIPGFRKGKAPESLIVQNFGKQLESEWKDTVLRTAFDEALKLTQLPMFNKESIQDVKIKKISLEDGAELFISYDSAPEIPSIDPQKIQLKRPRTPSVEPKELENTIDEVLLANAEWTDITDRGAQEGDFIVLDIVTKEDHPRVLCQDTLFHLAKEKMGDWMHKLILGATSGQVVEGMSEKAKTEECQACEDGTHDHSHEDAEFIPTLCQITIKKIRVAKMPKLDDEFVQKHKFESVDHFKKILQERILLGKKQEQQQHLERIVESKILELYPFDIPHSLVQDKGFQRKKEILEELKTKIEDATALREKTNEIEHRVEERLENDFRLYFLARKLVDEQKIPIYEKDLQEEFMQQMSLRSSGGFSYVTDTMDTQELSNRLYHKVLINKALNYLIEHASWLEGSQ